MPNPFRSFKFQRDSDFGFRNRKPTVSHKSVQWLSQVVDAKMLLAAFANRHLQALRPRAASGFHDRQFRRDRQSAVARPLLAECKTSEKTRLWCDVGEIHGNKPPNPLVYHLDWYFENNPRGLSTCLIHQCNLNTRACGFFPPAFVRGFWWWKDPGGYRCPTSIAYTRVQSRVSPK